MRDFRTLKVWERSHQLALAVYGATTAFPPDERYGLTQQIRRSCASIPANIAAGCGRSSLPEMTHFFQIAMGSASELEYHLLLARDLGLLEGSHHDRLASLTTEVKRMLATLINRLKARRSALKTDN